MVPRILADRKKIIRNVLRLLLIGLILSIIDIPYKVKAQQSTGWRPDERIPGYSDDTFTPILVADQNRIVHAFASQWVGDQDRQLAIVYRQWSLAGGWTKPVDVLLSPNGEARIQGAFVDSSGIAHVIFWGGDSKNANIYYSHAPIEIADESRAWSVPIVVGEGAVEPSSAAFVGDDKGNLVVVYTGSVEGSGLYAVHSNDSGQKWSPSAPVFLTYNAVLTPYSPDLYMGSDGLLHATWNVVTNTGVDQSLYYARYDVAQDQWTEPINLNERVNALDYFGPSYPTVVDNGQDVIIMYNNGNPFNGRPVSIGRPVQMVSLSSDHGETWRAPEVPFYQLLGRSGEHALVVDSGHVVHALFVQRVETVKDDKYKVLAGIWHSTFQNGFWSNPDVLNTSIAPHDVRAVVSQGNVLLVTWRQDPGEGADGVWYSYITLDSPELPVVQPPTQIPAPVATTSSPLNPDAAILSTPSAATLVPNLVNPPSAFAMNPAGALIVATIIISVVLLVIILAYRYIASRNT
jgi:hypothetical protein